ncbi:hypothetical protein [Rhodocyclus tenuis]|uniref:Uncharacterized protein n=1 Tax=Rhodocyclus tenuis TaxID=1066 RepID=A0A840G2J1_RHOTE|nr:hypothetical protein [Rhodocyclus tenuis]MBB4246633.1 hypothetical protein [Rhodocyclus tenuis]
MTNASCELPFDLNGQQVCALGSAPGSIFPPDNGEPWTIATVNGSQAVLGTFGISGSPKFTVFNTSLIKSSFKTNVATRKALRGLGTENLIVLSDENALRKRLHIKLLLFFLRYRYGTLKLLNTMRRVEVMEEVLQMSLADAEKPSNGIFLAFLALHLGARRVVMSGFSLSKAGHAYNKLNFLRGHVDADRFVLARAVSIGLPIFTTDSEFSAESGVPLL